MIALKNKKNKSTRKKNTGGLVFSAILITAFVVCSYFFMSMIDKVGQAWLRALLCIVVFVLFGLFLFYATRVGDGKQVIRFSPATLIIMDLPALYIVLAAMISQLPFSAEIVSCSPIIYLASIVLGYGIPYTFISGYEIDNSDSVQQDTNVIDDEINDDDFTVESEGSGEVVINDDDDEDAIHAETENDNSSEDKE